TRRIEAEGDLEAARRRAADAGAELAAVNQFLRTAATAPAGTRSLASELGVAAGYELALSASLGSLLGAGVVSDLRAGESVLDRGEGTSVLVAFRSGAASPEPAPLPAFASPRSPALRPPAPGAER